MCEHCLRVLDESEQVQGSVRGWRWEGWGGCGWYRVMVLVWVVEEGLSWDPMTSQALLLDQEL